MQGDALWAISRTAACGGPQQNRCAGGPASSRSSCRLARAVPRRSALPPSASSHRPAQSSAAERADYAPSTRARRTAPIRSSAVGLESPARAVVSGGASRLRAHAAHRHTGGGTPTSRRLHTRDQVPAVGAHRLARGARGASAYRRRHPDVPTPPHPRPSTGRRCPPARAGRLTAHPHAPAISRISTRIRLGRGHPLCHIPFLSRPTHGSPARSGHKPDIYPDTTRPRPPLMSYTVCRRSPMNWASGNSRRLGQLPVRVLVQAVIAASEVL